jgi:hypothetical protein
VQAGDIAGIGIHTGNALRGYDIGTRANACGARVVFVGIHATLFPEEIHQLGGAHAAVRGEGGRRRQRRGRDHRIAPARLSVVAPADDNSYPVALADLAKADRQRTRRGWSSSGHCGANASN